MQTSNQTLRDKLTAKIEQDKKQIEQDREQIEALTKEQLQKLSENLSTFVNNELNTIKTDIESQTQTIITNNKTKISGIETDMKSQIQTIKANNKTMLSGIETDIQSQVQKIKTKTKTKILGIETNLTDNLDKINNSAKKMSQILKTMLKGIALMVLCLCLVILVVSWGMIQYTSKRITNQLNEIEEQAYTLEQIKEQTWGLNLVEEQGNKFIVLPKKGVISEQRLTVDQRQALKLIKE